MVKKNVLFVVDERQMGGVSVLLSDILNAINLKKYNIDVMVLHDNGDYLDKLPKKVNIIYGSRFFDTVDYSLKDVIKSGNLRNIFMKFYTIFLMKTKLIGFKIRKERKKCIKKNYDVEVAFKDGFCALFTAYGDSKKKCHWLHTDYSMYDCTHNYRKLFEMVFPMFDKIVAISNSVLDRFLDSYKVSNTTVIYNLINEESIINRASEIDVKFDEKINLVSVGRIHNMKGYDRLIEVMNRLNEDNLLDDVVLRIIGDGPDFSLLNSLVSKYGLEDKVILMGKKKNPFPYVKASSLFLMCSRYEPFGLVVLESMVLGVPVLSTDVASINEIMDKNYGFVVENSEDGLYNGIKKFIQDNKLLNKYKKNLSGFKYDVEEIVLKIESLLDEV